MKKIGLLLMVAGIAAVALGVYGFITLSSSQFSGEMADWAIDTFNMLGGQNVLTPSQSFTLSIARNRVLLTIAGVACIAAGVMLCKRKEA